MPAGLFAGVSNKIYRDTASSWSTPTWDEITAAVDVQLPLERGTAEVKARLSEWIQHLVTLKSGRITFKMIADTSIADYNILRDAFINGTQIIYAVADQGIAVSGADYFKVTGVVTGFQLTQNLEEANMVDVTIDFVYSANVPVWTDVA